MFLKKDKKARVGVLGDYIQNSNNQGQESESTLKEKESQITQPKPEKLAGFEKIDVLFDEAKLEFKKTRNFKIIVEELVTKLQALVGEAKTLEGAYEQAKQKEATK